MMRPVFAEIKSTHPHSVMRSSGPICSYKEGFNKAKQMVLPGCSLVVKFYAQLPSNGNVLPIATGYVKHIPLNSDE